MTTTLAFKDKIDLPEWRPLAIAPTTSAVGECLAFDLRNNNEADPWIYQQAGTTTIERYHKANDEWMTSAAFTAVGVTPAAGSGMIFVPSHGPAGAVGGTPTTTSFTLAALPNSASVAANALANRGDGVGFRIRVINNKATTGAGLTEERTIIANTSGATPVVVLDSPLSGIPSASGDTYEILSGRVYILSSGTTAAGYWKAWDVATQTISGNLNTTNLSATIGTDFGAVALDERYVPYDRKPGEGFIPGGATYNAASTLNCIQATASGATTLTGSGMPAALTTNEYTNFNVHIVEDVTTPASVNQRVRIASHTSGASGIFTVASWPVATPSSSAKFVIENNNDFLLWTNGSTNTYRYVAGGYAADGNWNTTSYAVSPAAHGAGVMAEQCFSIEPDISRNTRHSHIVWFRGNSTVTAYVFDIANGSTGTWSATLAYANQDSTTFTTGTCSALDPAANQGRYLYISVNGTQRFKRFDMLNRVMETWCYLRYAASTAYVGGKVATYNYTDGTTKVGFLMSMRTTLSECFNCLLQR
jgi:hypothetical protein